MRHERSTTFLALLAAITVLSSCTRSEEPTASVPSMPGRSSPGVPSESPADTFVAGEPLPEGCHRRRPTAKQTIAFVADARAWALDTKGRRLTCLFEVDDAAPFAWGPQGDRVLLGGLEIRGFGPDAPRYPGVDEPAGAFDWGHPIGLALVYANGTARFPEKRFMHDGHIERLAEMPRGSYLDVAYHPSGLALGVAIEQHGRESIWLTTNEGTDPQRLVFSEGGTRFPSIAFTPDGTRLVWIAKHLNTYQLHWMDLADRTGFENGWRGEIGEEATNLHVGPDGELMAFDVGASCADRTATVALSRRVARPALPGVAGPTTVVGWLDPTTVLVAAGGCDGPLDLSAVDVLDQDVADLVVGAELAASRAHAPPAPEDVPAPPAESPVPDEGVG
jgi:hypothetical protein